MAAKKKRKRRGKPLNFSGDPSTFDADGPEEGEATELDLYRELDERVTRIEAALVRITVRAARTTNDPKLEELWQMRG